MTAYMPIVAETNLTIQVHIVMQCLIWTFSAEKNATKQQIQNERCKYHQRQLTRQNNLCCIAGHAIWKRLNWINSMIVSAFFFLFRCISIQFKSPAHVSQLPTFYLFSAVSHKSRSIFIPYKLLNVYSVFINGNKKKEK